MARTWSYLTDEDSKLYKQKAESLGITEYELTQRLILMFLRTPTNSKPNECLNCQYYHIASSNVIQMFMKLNEALTMVTPEYLRRKNRD